MENMESFLLFYISFISAVTRGFAGEVPTLHKSFTRKELAETFGVSHHDNVPVYEPTRIRGHIKLKDNIETALSFKAFGKEMHFNVSANKNFIADTHTTEFVDEYGNISKYVGVLGEFSFGSVSGDPDSHVALHHTGRGISGSIRTSNDLYIISPLPHRIRNDYNHVIYRASDNPNDPIIKKITKTEKEIGDDIEEHRRSRRSISEDLPKKTIELLIAADYKMLEFYGADVLPSYMLAIINIMAGYFHDVSLAYPVDIVVVKSVIFKTDIIKAKRMDDLLSGFGTWCNNHNNFDDNSEDHFDTALLLTRDGCSEGCGIVGLARFRASCSASRSQGVGSDKGFMASTILAHELGHVLGASHDGIEGEGCPDALNIMASGGNYGGGHALQWSNCSSKAIERTLISASCYDDIPPKKLTDSTFQLYGTVYNADRQCEFLYSDEYQRCIFEEDPCRSLSCNRKGSLACITRFFPALHGTSCGEDKWCIMGECVPNGRRKLRLELVVNGGWSPWSEYTDCNRACNVGAQWRVRRCENPEPARGGSLCKREDGELKLEEHGHYRTCSTQRCEKDTPSEDFYYPDRDAQCGALRSESVFCRYCRGISPCALWCGAKSQGTYTGTAQSGTTCVINSKNGVCMAGKCIPVGCDYKLISGEAKDRCGVCKGDGSTCYLVSGSDHTEYKSYGNWPVMTVPINASNAVVQEGGKTYNFLACTVGDSKSWAIPPRTYSKTISLDGATIYYALKYFPYQDKITITGTLKVPVHVFYSNYYYRGSSKGVYWHYVVVGLPPNRSSVEGTWVTGAFSACSHPCAGGFKTRDIYCRRKDDNTSVAMEICNGLSENKPEATVGCGTENCRARWYTSDWGDCSLSCGTGNRTRNITCSESTTSGEESVDEAKCSGTKPDDPTSEKCNDESCEAYWDTLSPFTPCSTSCEEGVSVREVGCRRLKKNTVLTLVPELECIAINKTEKPATRKVCNLDVECPKWKVEYSKCSVTCGTGVQQPSLICQGSQSEKLPFEKCDNSTKPPSSSITVKDCKLGECQRYKWVIKYGDCSTTCGKGTEIGMLVCKTIAGGTIVDDSLCNSQTKPPRDSRECELQACPLFHWKLIVVGCNVTCGDGLIVKELICYREDSKTKFTKVAPKHCDSRTEPVITKESCTLKPCPPTHRWKTTGQSCAIGCGKGSNIIEISCTNLKTGNESDYKYCAKLKTPTPNCWRNCRPVSSDLPDVYPIGCFRELTSNRRVPQHYANYISTYEKSNAKATIKKCAAGAKQTNFPFFALQSYGDCWIGDSGTVNTYDTAGKSTRCTSGTGEENVNYVFHIGGPIAAENIPPVVKYGCTIIRDTATTYRKPSVLALRRIVPICGLKAHTDKLEYFGGDSKGNCLSWETTRTAIDSPVFSRTCFMEREGMTQYYIYTFAKEG